MFQSGAKWFVHWLGLLGVVYAGNVASQWGYPPPGPYGTPWRPPAYPVAPRQEPAAPATAAPLAQDDYIRDAPRIVKETDWSKQLTVTVELSEYRYSPENLRFQLGTPYKLELVNRGGMKHYFTAPEFFRAIATRKVQSNRDGEIKAPYFTALEMMPEGGQLDLYFVPVRPGSYRVACNIPGHTEQGMVGTLIIE